VEVEWNRLLPPQTRPGIALLDSGGISSPTACCQQSAG